jgi:flagellar biogenesis protein FliO
MKTKLKVKIALVLSASIIINIFLIWEVFRLRNQNNKNIKSSQESQSLEDLWQENLPPEIRKE